MDFSVLLGQTLLDITNSGDELVFTTDEGRRFKLYYEPDCCANCSIEEIIGDLTDLLGHPLMEAEEVSNADDPSGFDPSSYDSYTWTFYKLRTIKGGVTIRWLGTSNGYYSESVSFAELPPVKVLPKKRHSAVISWRAHPATSLRTDLLIGAAGREPTLESHDFRISVDRKGFFFVSDGTGKTRYIEMPSGTTTWQSFLSYGKRFCDWIST